MSQSKNKDSCLRRNDNIAGLRLRLSCPYSIFLFSYFTNARMDASIRWNDGEGEGYGDSRLRWWVDSRTNGRAILQKSPGSGREFHGLF